MQSKIKEKEKRNDHLASAMCSRLGPPIASRELRGARRLPHEKLDVFNVAIELVEMIARLPRTRGQSSALDQVKRASQSIALNIAEGCGKEGKDRARFFSIARGSALETAAGLRVLMAVGALSQARHDSGRRLCERLYAMLTRMCR